MRGKHTNWKKHFYERGVEFIAYNDEPLDMDPESVRAYVSTILLAEVFNRPPEEVAQDVLRYRQLERLRERERERSKE